LVGTIRRMHRTFGFIDFIPNQKSPKKFTVFFHTDDVIGASKTSGELPLQVGDVIVFDLVEDPKKVGHSKAVNVSKKMLSTPGGGYTPKKKHNNSSKEKEFDIDDL